MVGLRVRTLLACSITLLANGCLAPQSDALTGLIASSSGSTTTTTASLSGDLYLTVSTAWETTPTVFETQITCKIDSGSPLVTSNCAGTIPEGQLHFSKIRFTVGTSNNSTCKMLIFYPYYYLGSQAAAYTPPWDPTATLDCSDIVTSAGGPADAGCYDGVGTEILTGFPDTVGMYFLTADGPEKSYDASSSNEKGRGNNRYTCNNKVDQTAAVADYVANTTQNYKVECRDQYFTLQKSITLTLGDADLEAGETPGAANDDFDDWLAP